MRYYSILRPFGLGTFPKKDGRETITNFNEPTFCEEIGKRAWGFIDYPEELTKDEIEEFELTPEGQEWYEVVISSKHRGGGIKAVAGESVKAKDRPVDRSWNESERGFKSRFFSSEEEAELAIESFTCLEVTIERVRNSVTQGCVEVFANGKYIVTFGDEFQIIGKDEMSYTPVIGGWGSKNPDSNFALGIFWHPFDNAYRFSDKIRKAVDNESLIGI